MEDLTVTPPAHHFLPLRRAMQRYVDQHLLAGVSYAVLHDQDVLDTCCLGWSDREGGIPLRADHIVRAMSNTKLVTTVAVMQLLEAGTFDLDDAIDRFIPQLANLQVLKAGATRLDDTEPARNPITIRHLLSHRSGLGYGLLDPGTLLFQAYNARRVLNPRQPLADMMDTLAGLPLLFQPGTAWEYSVATDVLGYLVEVVSGVGLDTYFQTHIFAPLGMVDTAFTLPPEKHGRLTVCYAGANANDPMQPGLSRLDKIPWRNAYLEPVAWLSGGGGLATTLPDTVALLRSFLPGGKAVLRPETIALMMHNQLPEGCTIHFAAAGSIPGTGFGLGGAVTFAPSPLDPPASRGEFHWGGLAGTHWWISPHTGLAGVLMAQRHMGFWHPFSAEFRRLAYSAAGY